MRRLRELVDSEDPAVAELARLVRASSPLDPPQGAQRRVRDALTASAQSRPLRRKPALIVLLAIAMPGAFATMYLRQPGDPALAPPALPGPRPAPDTQRAPAAPPAAALPVPAGPSASEKPLAVLSKPHIDAQRSEPRISRPDLGKPPPRGRVAPPVTTGIAPPDAPQASRLPTSDAAAASPPRAPARSEAAVLVLGALRSLRRDHDALAAIRQLEAYRLQFPSGDLAEEALALTIEAFAALDDRAALAFADEYLQRFPEGQFRDQAERAQRRFRGGP